MFTRTTFSDKRGSILVARRRDEQAVFSDTEEFRKGFIKNCRITVAAVHMYTAHRTFCPPDAIPAIKQSH
jgi:hypothetical protein